MRALLMLAGCLLCTPALAGIVCWTDNDGRRACGDRVPPEYAKSQRQILNPQGQVVETRTRELSEAERAQQAESARALAQAQKQQAEQAAYDRFLLQGYNDVAELERARDERLATLDQRRALALSNVARGDEALAGLNRQLDAEPTNAEVKADFERTQASTAQARKSVLLMDAERSQLCEQAQRDIRRFQTLKGLPASAPSACAPP